jgi:hypothetical protein
MRGALPVCPAAVGEDAFDALERRILAPELYEDLPRGLPQRPQPAPMKDLGAQPVARGAEAGPVQGVIRRWAPERGLGRADGQPASKGGDAGGRGEVRLDVDLPKLDRAEPRLRPCVPPHHRLVRRAPAGTDRVEDLQVVVPVVQGGRYAASGVSADDRRPRARHSGVEPKPERRGGAEPVQQRKRLAQAVQHRHGGGRVGHANVHVQRAFGRAADEAAHLVLHAPIALRGDETDVAVLRIGVHAGGEQPRAGLSGHRPSFLQLRDRLRGRSARLGAQLELREEGLVVRSAVGQVDARQDPVGRVGQAKALVDQQQFLFEPDAERRTVAERGVLGGAHGACPSAARAAIRPNTSAAASPLA